MKNCHCGKPIHYPTNVVEALVNAMIELKGYYIDVKSLVTNKTYKVPRQYIAVHGLKGDEVDKLGFEEVVGAGDELQETN